MSDEPITAPREFIPGRNGGRLLLGGKPGNKGGPGRPPSTIRAVAREEFADLIPELVKIARSKTSSKADKCRAIDLLGKYGLGTTVTETDTEGRDRVIRVVREPRRVSVDSDN